MYVEGHISKVFLNYYMLFFAKLRTSLSLVLEKEPDRVQLGDTLSQKKPKTFCNLVSYKQKKILTSKNKVIHCIRKIKKIIIS